MKRWGKDRFNRTKPASRRMAGVAGWAGCLMFLALSAHGQPFGGLVVLSGIDFKGNAITVDSFDSSTNTHSVWQTNLLYHGQPYGIWSNSLSFDTNSLPCRTADATVATDGSIINVGNAKIGGYVDTAPAGTVAVASRGSVGDLNWAFVTQTPGIQQGHIKDDMNQVFSSFNLPVPKTPLQSTWLPVPIPPGGSTNINGIAYSLIITNRPANSNLVYYSIGQLGSSIFLNASNVVLYLTNGLSYSGSQMLTLNTNADVQIWTTGNISTSGNAIISNLNGNARALSFYDVSGNPIIMSFGGVGFGVGYLYAPGSSVVFDAGGLKAYDVAGAIFCHDLTFNGRYNFHFDESLGSYLPAWIVFPPTNQIVPLGSNASFTVDASGSSLSYQWLFHETNLLANATSASLSLTNVQLADAGYYSVVVSNMFGSVTSAPASLVVFTNATPVLSGVAMAANGQFEFNISGVTGLSYIVQTSTNLVDWVPLATNDSPFTFADPGTVQFPQRFYRSVHLP